MPASAPKLTKDDSNTRPDGGILSPQKNIAIACLLLAVVTLGFYNPISHCGFVYSDDVVYIMRNPAIRAGLSWETVKWAFVGVHAGFWHPLTWLSHALDYQLFGLNPAGHHYVNLLFHVANSILLFLLLLEATAAGWPSLMVAALFALHPENVESVAWAAERKNVLSMCFFLLALWSYGRYARRGGAGRYVSVTICFALGLMAKPQVITLPCALLLWDYWPLGRMFAKASRASNPPRSFSYLIKEKVPFFLIAAAASLITFWTQRVGSAVRTVGELPVTGRLGNALVSYVRYISHTFWPVHLSPEYPHPGLGLPIWQVVASLLFLIFVTAIVLFQRSHRHLPVGWFWFLGTLVPMIGIVQVGDQAMADRFAYIPMIGLFVMLVWTAADLAEQKPILKSGLAITSAIVLITLGVLTYRQLAHWRDGETLWKYALSVTDRNYVAHDNLAMVFDGEGKPDEAIQEFRASEEIHQYPPDQILKIGMYEQRNGHFNGAVEQYQKALQASSDLQLRAAAWTQAGDAYAQMADYAQAKQSYLNALQVNVDNPAALVATAMLAERERDFPRAVDNLTHLVKIAPSDIGYILLADALKHAGRLQESQAVEETARRASRNFSEAEKNATQTQLFFGYNSN
ncbi:MAG TPA: hypothetical protein VMH04_09700 [Candidatus Solibacter sp.]|nr:hypothetical protein [Candidatus Solibacter sp.]